MKDRSWQTIFKNVLSGILFLGGIACLSQVQAQTIYTPFGKNRVQYHDDFDSWWMYETEHFVTFWYGKGRNIAKSVMQLAEMDHDEIQGLLAHSMNDKIRIIIYLDVSDYNQTNIAYWENREAGGAALSLFSDNKAIVYFDGNHQHLRRQIREGIVKAYLQSMFDGISIQDIYYDLMSTELPPWFVTGLVDYIAEPWPPRQEQFLREMYLSHSKKLRHFGKFAKDYPELAGHSMWHYLSSQYGRESLSDFLYLVRIHQNVDKAFRYAFRLEAKSIYSDWNSYYQKLFSQKRFEGPLDSTVHSLGEFDFPVTHLMLCPGGDTLYYVENRFGRVRLIKKELESGKKHTLLTYGYYNPHQIPDLQYPLLALEEPSGRLGVILERKSELFFRHYYPGGKSFEEVLFPESVQRIYSFAFEKPGFLFLNATIDGFTDLFMFELEKRTLQRVTDAYFDEGELIPWPSASATDFLVTSNHPGELTEAVAYDSFPPLGKMDVFRIHTDEVRSFNLTGSHGSNEMQVRVIDTSRAVILGDFLGYRLPEIWMEGDSGRWYRKSIIPGNFEINTQAYRDGTYAWTSQTSPDTWRMGVIGGFPTVIEPDLPYPDWLAGRDGDGSLNAIMPVSATDAGKEPLEIDPALQFQTRFPDMETVSAWIPETDAPGTNVATQAGQQQPTLPVFQSARAVASRLRFSFSDWIMRVDNEALFEGMEAFNDINNRFSPPPSGLLVKTTVRDLFEDHLLEGGIRLASDFRGMEYFLTYHRLKRKIDYSYSLYRKASVGYDFITQPSGDADKIRQRTNLGQFRLSFPLDTYRRWQGTATLRSDQTLITATGLSSLQIPDIQKQRLLIGLEYIFDNTSKKAPNLLSGIRYKAFTGVSNAFDIKLTSPLRFDLSEGIMGWAGFDFRVYQDIWEHSSLAVRLTGQSSFGPEKNIYFLGGMENWYFGRYDESYPVPQDQSFAFMIQAANVRGFPYNIRNGSSFALANVEFRFPLFSYLLQGHARMAFIRDFQFTAFFDTGMAWYGLTPFSRENEANVFYLEAPPAIKLRIRQFNDPLVGGMGIGWRTTLFGYFVKLDYAWGIQNGVIGDPLLYFSVGYDF